MALPKPLRVTASSSTSHSQVKNKQRPHGDIKIQFALKTGLTARQVAPLLLKPHR